MIIEHAELAPSAMARTIQCAASRWMCDQYPQQPDDAKSQEGTAAHWVLSRFLSTGETANEAELSPNGIETTREMVEGAELFADTVKADGVKQGVARIEQRVNCFDLHPECWGTPDYWVFDEDTGILYIYDYKFGHRFVEVFENWQLLTYLAGVLRELGARARILRIELRVVQPRSYHKSGPVRTWTLALNDTPYYAKRISEACYASMQDAPLATTGAECYDCSARHVCQTYQSKALAGVEMASRGIPVELTPEAAGNELRVIWNAIRTLEGRANGLVASVTHAMRAGVFVPGVKLEASKGSTVWSVPIPQVLSMGKALGIDLQKPAVLTPKQAIAAGVTEDVVTAFSQQKAGAISLVEDTGIDTRKAFQPEKE